GGETIGVAARGARDDELDRPRRAAGDRDRRRRSSAIRQRDHTSGRVRRLRPRAGAFDLAGVRRRPPATYVQWDAWRVLGRFRVLTDLAVVFGGAPMSNEPIVDRRHFCGAAAASFAAGSLGILGLSRRLEAMTEALIEPGPSTRVEPNEIRPFRVNVPDADL